MARTTRTSLPRLRAALAEVLLAHAERVLARAVYRLAKAVDDDAVLAAVDGAIAADVQSLVEDLQDDAVLGPLADAYTGGAQEAADSIGVEVGITWGLKNPAALAYASQRAAELVGMQQLPNGRLVPNPNATWRITDQTRTELARLVNGVLESDPGLSYRDLKAQVEALPAFSGLFGEYRAEAVARTELAIAANQGTIDTYQQMDVAQVEVIDNPLCPLCADAAGTIQSVEWARDNPLRHPNCTRSFNAVLPTHRRPAKALASTAAAFAKEGETAGITTATGLVGHNLEGRQPHCMTCGYAPCRCENAPGDETCPSS